MCDNMSQPCAAPKCERTSRALCDCCQQNLCLQHLHEHNTILVSKLNPLTDEIHALGDRLNRMNMQQTFDECREKLEQWCLDCHQKIDYFFEQKYKELDQFIATRTDGQRVKIFQLQSKIAKLIRGQEATRQDLDTLTSTIGQIEKEIQKIEQTRFSINTRPLLIDENLVQINALCAEEFDASAVSLVYKTIASAPGSWRVVTNNDRLLLINQGTKLCFVNTDLKIVKQVSWPYDTIEDMCWSSTLDQFIVIVNDSLFLVDENTMSIVGVDTVEKRNWISCTCFKEQLFLSTNEWGSSIVEVSLLPSIAIIKEWKSPLTCAIDECIDDIVYNNGSLAVMISNPVEKSIRIELRSSKTLGRLWSLVLDVAHEDLAYRCCSLDNNGWLVADYTAGSLLYITTDGKIKETIPYKEIPYRITLFRSNMLAIASESRINFHKI